jgi:hypothetical protein
VHKNADKERRHDDDDDDDDDWCMHNAHGHNTFAYNCSIAPLLFHEEQNTRFTK